MTFLTFYICVASLDVPCTRETALRRYQCMLEAGDCPQPSSVADIAGFYGLPKESQYRIVYPARVIATN